MLESFGKIGNCKLRINLDLIGGVVAIGAIGGAIASKMNDNGNQANHAVVANAIS